MDKRVTSLCVDMMEFEFVTVLFWSLGLRRLGLESCPVMLRRCDFHVFGILYQHFTFAFTGRLLLWSLSLDDRALYDQLYMRTLVTCFFGVCFGFWVLAFI